MESVKNNPLQCESHAPWHDQADFTALVERHRSELRLHCYRMLGSYHESEDLVQEALLRAWRSRHTLQGRATARAWLYRITTNACLDHLKRRKRTPVAAPSTSAVTLGDEGAQLTEVTWLEPYPDRLMEHTAPRETEPETALVERETIELAFLAAIQHLTARQRAVLLLREVLSWSASETAELLETSVPSVNSALQRARLTLSQRLPHWRSEGTPAATTDVERDLLRRYMEAHERTDMTALASILREDVVMTMPPEHRWCAGLEAVATMLRPVFDPGSPDYLGHLRMRPTWANRQPAAGIYLRRPGDEVYRAYGLDVLRIDNGRVAEVMSFRPERFSDFGLPETL